MAGDVKDVARARAALVLMASAVAYVLCLVRLAAAGDVTPSLRATVVAENGPAFRVGQLSPHAVISPDGRLVATLSGHRNAVVWDLGTGERIFRIDTTRRYETDSVGFSPDSRFLVAVAPDRSISLWDIKTRRRVLLIDGDRFSTVSAKFSPTGSALATVGDDGTVTVWKLDPIGRRFEIPAGTLGDSSVIFTHDGEVLIVAETDGTLQLYDVNSGRRGPRVQPLRNEKLVSAVFLSVGETRLIALRNSEGTIRIYNVKRTARGISLKPAKYFETTPLAAALFGEVGAGRDANGNRPGVPPAPRVPLMSEGRFVVIDFEEAKN